MRRTLLLLVFAALPAIGCKKASDSAPAAYPDESYAADGVAQGGMAPEAPPPVAAPADDTAVGFGATAEPMADMEMEKKSIGSYRRSVRENRKRKDAPVRDPAGSRAPGGGTTGGESPKAEPADDKPETDAADRQIIYTATMQVSVFNLEDATKKAEELPEKHGGYIQSMTAGQLVLKIPAAKLRTVMTELAGFGVVDQRTLSSQDVTDEFLDIETRIRVLQETQSQLIALLGKARTVDEALHVRQTLDQITMELEVLKGRLRQLENLVAYSTLTLTLVERGPFTPTPSTNDPFQWVNELGVEATEWK
jgi:uncharacterized protein YprB with RNaseH-like and TPR domain